MITVVIDTGVIVSAAFRDRTPEKIVLFIIEEDDFEWAVSPAILAEYNGVLSRPKFDLPLEILQAWRETFEQNTTLINVEASIDFPRDQEDAKFLECAIVASANYLITGDKDFTEARKLVETTIISVSQFEKLILERWK
jgi:putative PIN family toxin of toxin-antitoxin system